MAENTQFYTTIKAIHCTIVCGVHNMRKRLNGYRIFSSVVNPIYQFEATIYQKEWNILFSVKKLDCLGISNSFSVGLDKFPSIAFTNTRLPKTLQINSIRSRLIELVVVIIYKNLISSETICTKKHPNIASLLPIV